MKFTYKYATVTKIYDGDTVKILADVGRDTFIGMKIRMFGVWAPETRTRDGAEKQLGFQAKEMLESIIPVGTKVVVVTSMKESFSRYIGVIFKDDININETMAKYCKDVLKWVHVP